VAFPEQVAAADTRGKTGKTIDGGWGEHLLGGAHRDHERAEKARAARLASRLGGEEGAECFAGEQPAVPLLVSRRIGHDALETLLAALWDGPQEARQVASRMSRMALEAAREELARRRGGVLDPPAPTAEPERSEELTPRRCSRCKEVKPASEFYRDRTGRDGLSYHCKPCRDSYMYKRRRAK
jgi:hypothetical protein